MKNHSKKKADFSYGNSLGERNMIFVDSAFKYFAKSIDRASAKIVLYMRSKDSKWHFAVSTQTLAEDTLNIFCIFASFSFWNDALILCDASRQLL